MTTTLASQTLTMVSASRWMFQRFDAWLKQSGISSHGILMNWKASWKGKLANRKGDEAFWKDVIFIHFPMMFLNRVSGQPYNPFQSRRERLVLAQHAIKFSKSKVLCAPACWIMLTSNLIRRRSASMARVWRIVTLVALGTSTSLFVAQSD